MRSDNSAHLLAAARKRSSQTRHRAEAAIARITDTAAPVTFDTVAREAGVSRSWLYAQPDLCANINRLRQRTPTRTEPATTPQRQHASDASLLRRLEAATDRIRRLEQDNRELKAALERALGQNREADITGHPARRDTPTNRISQVTCS
jgi:AraC-like DNA-binding protein